VYFPVNIIQQFVSCFFWCSTKFY